MRVNSGIELVESRGYKVYDLDNYKSKIGLKLEVDYYNTGHPNVFGQEKITDFFFEMLYADYEIDNKHSDEIIKRWNKDYQTFTKLRDKAKQKYYELKPGEDFVYTFDEIDDIKEQKS